MGITEGNYTNFAALVDDNNDIGEGRAGFHDSGSCRRGNAVFGGVLFVPFAGTSFFTVSHGDFTTRGPTDNFRMARRRRRRPRSLCRRSVTSATRPGHTTASTGSPKTGFPYSLLRSGRRGTLREFHRRFQSGFQSRARCCVH